MKIEELGLEGDVLENVKKLIQSEGDRVRTEYSTKVKELEGKLPVQKSETELALEQRLKALEDKEKELNKRERLNKVQSTLKDKGLNSELAKYLNCEGVDNLETYLDEVVGVIGSQINDYKPKGHEGKSNKVTKAEFEKMGFVERTELYENNFELYKALSE